MPYTKRELIQFAVIVAVIALVVFILRSRNEYTDFHNTIENHKHIKIMT